MSSAATPSQVHVVLSTQYQDKPYDSSVPHSAGFPVFLAAVAAKQLLEAKGFCVYNPNTDNTHGDEHWDRSFHAALDRAKQTHGFVLSLRDHPDINIPDAAKFSDWQRQEALWAEERGLPVEIYLNDKSINPFQDQEKKVEALKSLLSRPQCLPAIMARYEKVALPLVDDHLRLGITIESMEAFVMHELRFPHEYRRDETELAWVTSTVGPVKDTGDDVDARNLTGYDLAAAIRAWLKMQGQPGLSVCEVLQMRGHPGVGKANVFYSHIQSLCAVRCEGTFYNAVLGCDFFESELPTPTYFWMDYFVLRQCHNDFHPDAIGQVIADIGCTMVELDRKMLYLTRSFCVFELYSAIASNSKVLLNVDASMSGMSNVQNALHNAPIDAAQAASLHDDDKRKIDHYISSSVGFEALNAEITRAVLEGARVRESYFRNL